MDAEGRWIGRGEALTRLGVKAQTLYAYVSRGRIAARPDPADPRRSLYAVDDIARMASGQTSAPDSASLVLVPVQGAAARGEASILSSVGVVAGGRLFYRGLDAAQLSQNATVEDVARRLWHLREANPFPGLKPRVDAVMGGSARARLYAALGRRAQEDAPSTGRAAADLRHDAASVLNEAVDAVAGPGPRLHFHQRLARGWKVLERDAHLIRRALVLSADHDLDAAVLTTRAAAGGGAPMAGAALAGITTLAGSTLAIEVASVSAWLFEARRDPAASVRRRFETEGTVPGFGTSDWPDGDPRATALLSAADLPTDLAAVLHQGRAVSGHEPGLALALALVARRLDLPREGASDLLMIGRLTGLLAHALDQAIDGSPIRARLRYVGPEPGAN
ncbi:citrate/2-methylcitrate synthase [Brevundimonas sp.]|uniref:citrate/2-methylcitrate synthase n=1 Tax=Brevundimonas sp. TaxID=1871086 RepID=UPI002AB822B2|nr:citrate/2-methylcitrate synthase [Brevundimonas sp.]MDZ4362938.1 citrate/2-methylcitrate synthase [Brevundimonas sp.]